jgi:hypothetical protein
MLKCINAYKGNYSKVGQHACRQSGTNSHTHMLHMGRHVCVFTDLLTGFTLARDEAWKWHMRHQHHAYTHASTHARTHKRVCA